MVMQNGVFCVGNCPWHGNMGEKITETFWPFQTGFFQTGLVKFRDCFHELSHDFCVRI